jgi:hypothetical protein
MEIEATKTKNKHFDEIMAPSAFFYTLKSQRAITTLLQNPRIDLFPGDKTEIS